MKWTRLAKTKEPSNKKASFKNEAFIVLIQPYKEDEQIKNQPFREIDDLSMFPRASGILLKLKPRARIACHK